MSVAPLESRGHVSTESKGHVLQCGAFKTFYGWSMGRVINVTNTVSYTSSTTYQLGQGYYNGEWLTIFMENVFQQPNAPANVWTIPNYLGIPKPGAAPGLIDPDTGLPFVLVQPLPLVFTFGQGWDFITVADFSASVGVDYVGQGYVGMFAVCRVPTPSGGTFSDLTVQLQNPCKAGVYAIHETGLSQAEQLASGVSVTVWNYTYLYLVTLNSGEQFIDQVSAANGSAQTNQIGGISQLIGLKSGKIIDLSAIPNGSGSQQAGNYNTAIGFGSSEPFFIRIIFPPVVPLSPVTPVSIYAGSTGVASVVLLQSALIEYAATIQTDSVYLHQ